MVVQIFVFAKTTFVIMEMVLQVHIRIIIENQVMHAKKAVKFAIQVLLEVEQFVVNMEPMHALQRNLVSLFSFSILLTFETQLLMLY